MVDSRDQLFLRLCERNGIYTEQESAELLAYYRDSAGVKEGIGHFLVREGYLDENVANKLRQAIAKRADGHVVDSRKKVPSLNKTRGAKTAQGGGGARHHHAQTRARTVSADPMQLTLIAVGMIVAIVAVVWIVWEMNSGSSPDELVRSSMESEKARTEARYKEEQDAKAKAAREAQATAEITFSSSEIEKYEDQAKDTRRTALEACVDLGKGPRRGLEILDAGVKNLQAERVPEEQIRILTDARKDILEMLDSKYKELHSAYKKASADGDSERAEELLEQIKTECGDEWSAKAAKS